MHWCKYCLISSFLYIPEIPRTANNISASYINDILPHLRHLKPTVWWGPIVPVDCHWRRQNISSFIIYFKKMAADFCDELWWILMLLTKSKQTVNPPCFPLKLGLLFWSLYVATMRKCIKISLLQFKNKCAAKRAFAVYRLL